jgi:hypothetical protein
MVLHGLDMPDLAPDLDGTGTEVSGQVIEARILELCGGLRHGFCSRFQHLEFVAQDFCPSEMYGGS